MATETLKNNRSLETSTNQSLSELANEVKNSMNTEKDKTFETLGENESAREFYMKEITDKIDYFKLWGASKEYLEPYVNINNYLRNKNYLGLQKYLNKKFSDSNFDSLISEIIGYIGPNKKASALKLQNYFNNKGVKCRIEGDKIRVNKIQENGKFDSQTVSYLSLFLIINAQRGE